MTALNPNPLSTEAMVEVTLMYPRGVGPVMVKLVDRFLQKTYSEVDTRFGGGVDVYDEVEMDEVTWSVPARLADPELLEEQVNKIAGLVYLADTSDAWLPAPRVSVYNFPAPE